jgi:hypothetical protein
LSGPRQFSILSFAGSTAGGPLGLPVRLLAGLLLAASAFGAARLAGAERFAASGSRRPIFDFASLRIVHAALARASLLVFVLSSFKFAS